MDRATRAVALLGVVGLALLGAACEERGAAAAKPAPAATAPPAAAPAAAPAAPAPAANPAAAAEACADRWLAERHLNQFGDAEGTSYAGGTPLFDEKTGQRKSRLDLLFGKHEALKAACSGAAPK